MTNESAIRTTDTNARSLRTVRRTALMALSFSTALLGAQNGERNAPPRIETPPAGAEASARVFAPFVSRLKVAVRDDLVKLTWMDSRDSNGAYRIYRSTEPITEASLERAELIASVDPGDESYLDTPPEIGTYWYAVLAEDETGTLHRILIPFRNASVSPAEITVVSPEESAASITGLSASAGDDTVALRYISSRPDRSLLVYRSQAPIQAPEDLQSAIVLSTVPSSETTYTDYPVPGVTYYYALLDTATVESGDVAIEPGRNSTPNGVSIALGTIRSGLPRMENTARAMPLPALLLSREVRTGERIGNDMSFTLPERRELPPSTAKAAGRLLSGLPSEPPPNPMITILSDDLASEREGEEATLRQIIDGSLRSQRWKETIELLEKFLTVPRSPAVSDRARFYLGQARYFAGERDRAILEFLIARDRYYAETESWLTVLFNDREHETRR